MNFGKYLEELESKYYIEPLKNTKDVDDWFDEAIAVMKEESYKPNCDTIRIINKLNDIL